MDKFELIKELRALDIRRYQIVKEMSEFIIAKTEEKRNFKDGEVVAVFDEMGRYLKDGIVSGAMLFVGLESFEIAQYITNPERYEDSLNEVRYKVKAIKKDGTMSAQNAVNSSTISEKNKHSSYFIKKKFKVVTD